jgi:hypothetical protein
MSPLSKVKIHGLRHFDAPPNPPPYAISTGTFDPNYAVEIKWSDNIDADAIRGLVSFAKKYKLAKVTITSRTQITTFETDGVEVQIFPSSYYCLNLGRLASRSAIELNWGTLAAA